MLGCAQHFEKGIDMNEILDWAEKAGLENLKFRLQTCDTLAKDAGTTLTVLLAGLGATLAYAMKGAEESTSSALTVGAGAMAGWLMFVASVLICKCITTTPIWPPTNEPRNLYQKTYAWDDLREVELENLQKRIDQTAERNLHIAMWLDRVRLMAVASPLIFLAGAFLSWAVLGYAVRVVAAV
jgi:hypothetical protein